MFDENTITLELVVQMFEATTTTRQLTVYVEYDGNTNIIDPLIIDLEPIDATVNTTVRICATWTHILFYWVKH